jgi:hypothetical protein
MLTIKTVKSKPKKPLSPLMGKGRGKKLAAELFKKPLQQQKLKPLFAELEFYGPGKQGLTNSLILKILKRQRT